MGKRVAVGMIYRAPMHGSDVKLIVTPLVECINMIIWDGKFMITFKIGSSMP